MNDLFNAKLEYAVDLIGRLGLPYHKLLCADYLDHIDMLEKMIQSTVAGFNTPYYSLSFVSVTVGDIVEGTAKIPTQVTCKLTASSGLVKEHTLCGSCSGGTLFESLNDHTYQSAENLLFVASYKELVHSVLAAANECCTSLQDSFGVYFNPNLLLVGRQYVLQFTMNYMFQGFLYEIFSSQQDFDSLLLERGVYVRVAVLKSINGFGGIHSTEAIPEQYAQIKNYAVYLCNADIDPAACDKTIYVITDVPQHVFEVLTIK